LPPENENLLREVLGAEKGIWNLAKACGSEWKDYYFLWPKIAGLQRSRRHLYRIPRAAAA
jgi:hypothetical protein